MNLYEDLLFQSHLIGPSSFSFALLLGFHTDIDLAPELRSTDGIIFSVSIEMILEEKDL